jgi:hypothetical protein
MKIVGVDLSGPTNIAETALAWFRVEGEELICEGSHKSGKLSFGCSVCVSISSLEMGG